VVLTLDILSLQTMGWIMMINKMQDAWVIISIWFKGSWTCYFIAILQHINSLEKVMNGGKAIFKHFASTWLIALTSSLLAKYQKSDSRWPKT
jgi:hypothetical protein